MNNYFDSCRTAEELKKKYRKLAAKLHPDNNHDRDTTKDFQELQQEYEKAWDRLKNVHVNAAGETYTKETTETAREFMDLVNDLLNIPGLTIELCGSWVWISGDTKPVKDKLKMKGFKWSNQKLAWYWHEGGYRKRSKKSLSLDDIRNMYGSATYAAGPEPGYIPA